MGWEREGMPEAASHQKLREEKGGPSGGGWMGRPALRVESMWPKVWRSWMTEEGIRRTGRGSSLKELWKN